MDTGSSNFHGDGDDVGLDIGYTDDFARDQPDDAVKWLSKYGVRGSLDNSQADSCQYQYLSLEESKCIRLLVLCPSPSPNDDLKGFLRHVKLDISPPFEALSYVWGQKDKDGDENTKGGGEDTKDGGENAEDDLPITITISPGYLDVTENLNDALRALRFERKERILWVDALCINQNDKEEKSVQVAMMGEIYQKAHSVVVWLGKDKDGDSLMGFESAGRLFQIGRKFGLVSLEPPRTADKLEVESDLKTTFQNHQSEIQLASQDIYVEALLSLLKSPWFTRIWTIQEIALSKAAVVQSGRRHVPWDTLATAIFILNFGISFRDSSGEDLLVPGNYRAPVATAYLCVRARLNDVGRVQMEARASTEQASALRVLPYFVMVDQANKGESRDCTDDRDRLYALLSLWPKQTRPETKPDFTPKYTLSAEEVYTDFARCALRAGALEILDFAGLWFRKPLQQSSASTRASLNSNLDLPSWAPEFRLSQMGFVQEFRNRTGQHPDMPWVCVESRDLFGTRKLFLDDCIRLPIEGRRICMKGAIVDKVVEARFGVRSRSITVDPLMAWLPRCALMCTEYAVSGRYQPTGEPINNAFARTIAADGPLNINDNSGANNIYNLSYINQSDFEDLLHRFTIQSISGRLDNKMEEIMAYGMALRHIFLLCAFFVTENALMGLGPHNTMAGDVVVHFNGMRWPFLLRPVPGTDDFQLVGQCYLHGYMRGENEFPGERRWISLV
jgi:hypothetical protein